MKASSQTVEKLHHLRYRNLQVCLCKLHHPMCSNLKDKFHFKLNNYLKIKFELIQLHFFDPTVESRHGIWFIVNCPELARLYVLLHTLCIKIMCIGIWHLMPWLL